MLTIRKEKLNAVPVGFADKLRDEVRLAMEGIGVSTINDSCYSELCFAAGLERCVLASFSDVGDHIEFGLSLRGNGIRKNLVHALLVMEDADFWVSSDVYPELNGRVKLNIDSRALFDKTLATIRGPRPASDTSETRTSMVLPKSVPHFANDVLRSVDIG